MTDSYIRILPFSDRFNCTSRNIVVYKLWLAHHQCVRVVVLVSTSCSRINKTPYTLQWIHCVGLKFFWCVTMFWHHANCIGKCIKNSDVFGKCRVIIWISTTRYLKKFLCRNCYKFRLCFWEIESFVLFPPLVFELHCFALLSVWYYKHATVRCESTNVVKK